MKIKYLIIGIVIFFIILLVGINFGVSWGKIKSPLADKNQNNEVTRNTSPVPLVTVAPTEFLPLPTATPTALPTKTPINWNEKYGPCKTVPVLMYHHVMDGEKAKEIGAQNLNVPPDVFRQQVDYLLGKGYQIIGLNEMIIGIRNNSLPPKPVVLTFDDGYNNFYSNVFPLLKEKNVKATVFVITQFVGGDRYLTWPQIKEMAGSGLVLIGDHTLNHLSMGNISPEETKNQIVSAKSILEQNIGMPVEYFAYPYGTISEAAKTVLKDAGFQGAVLTTNTNPQCLGLPYQLSRIRIGAASLARFGL